jgi:ketosteroid isomerase-like protein
MEEDVLLRLIRGSAVLLAVTACEPDRARPAETERSTIADTLAAMIASAHDFASPGDQVSRLMSLYAGDRVISTSGGLITTTRDSLDLVIREFWESVGVRMQQPAFRWDEVHVDVLGRDGAVLTGRYSIPHLNPRGEPHVVAGVWTAVFARRDGEWRIIQEHLSEATAQADAPASEAEPHHH